MTLVQVQKPEIAAVSVADLKRHLRIEQDEDDDYLFDLIDAAVKHVEFSCHHHLITQVWRQYFGPPDYRGHFELAIRPVQRIESVSTYDVHGNAKVLDTSDYQVSRHVNSTHLKMLNPVGVAAAEIDVQTGFGDTAFEVPSSLQRAVLVLAAHWFEFRGAVSIDEHPADIPRGFNTLIAPYRNVLV